jgi:hypothetical protein
MQAVFNAGFPHRESKPTKLVALGSMPSGRHFDLGTVIEIVANAIDIIERGLAERPTMKETLAISYPASGMDGHSDGVTSLPDLMAQTGNVTAVLVPLKTIARWRARHDSKFQLEIERGVPVVVCDRHEFEDTLVSLVRSAEEAMGAGAQLLVNVEREDGVDQEPYRETSPDLRFYESCFGMGAVTTRQALSPLLSAVRRKGSGMTIAMEFELGSNHTATDVTAFRTEAVITMRLRRIWAANGLAPGNSTESDWD